MRKLKKVIPIMIAFIIGISTTVGAATVFNSKDIKYSSDKTTKTNVKDSLDELYSKIGKCPDGQYCFWKPMPLLIVEIGDYISMTPTSTSYTPPSELTGCLNDSNCTQNTINPSELNLWRVIRKNNDGTVDLVSEYVSSTYIHFYGKDGYIKLIKGLNEISKQYINDKYVLNIRHIGYSNQTEILNDINSLSSTTAPFKKTTSVWEQWLGCNTSEYLCGADEIKGAGDIGYETDYTLVNGSLGTMAAKTPTGREAQYYLASRRYFFDSQNNDWRFGARRVENDGSLDCLYLYDHYDEYINVEQSRGIRPIITLKSSILLSGGDGKSAKTAYQLK